MNLVERLRKAKRDWAVTPIEIFGEAADRIEALEKQRDVLLKALEKVLRDVPCDGLDDWEIQARAAIASVKEKA